MRKGKQTILARSKTSLGTALEHGMIAGVAEARHAVTGLQHRVMWSLVAVVLVTALAAFGSGLGHAFTDVAARL